MVKFNSGRFMFRFDPKTKKLIAVYDSKYEADYEISNPAFNIVFECAVQSLSNDALDELRVRMIEEPKYVKIISDIIYERKNS